MTASIIRTLSNPRFETYLHAAGFDERRALDLYIWNAKIGASFHLPIQCVEVALRNSVNHGLMAKFGQIWWDDQKFLRLADRERIRDLDTTKIRLSRQGKLLDNGQVVASLSFGFWVGLMQPRYNPDIWGDQLKKSFLYLPAGINRQELFRKGGKIAKFRNRISHHEPLIKEDISKRYSEVFEMLKWLCPDTQQWIRSHCDTPKLIRQKP